MNVQKNKTKTSLITGATSGFGKAIAYRLASEGRRIIITGRRQERLDEISCEISKWYNTEVNTLCFDIRDKSEVNAALATLPAEWQNIDELINNAGLAVGRDHVSNGDTEDWERMIDTNLKGLLYVTRAVLPRMIEAKSGHIINIGSIAGKEVYPGGNVYCATKFAVDALTKAMRIELVHDGVKVSQIAPGAAETEFSIVRFKGDETTAGNVYKGFVPLSADDIADAAWYILSRPEHVCINDMIIMPAAQASATLIHKTTT